MTFLFQLNGIFWSKNKPLLNHCTQEFTHYLTNINIYVSLYCLLYIGAPLYTIIFVLKLIKVYNFRTKNIFNYLSDILTEFTIFGHLKGLIRYILFKFRISVLLYI